MSRIAPPRGPFRGGLQDETQLKNRLLLGRIESVDADKGQALVTLPQAQEQLRITIPVLGFSIQGLTSSWIRYMPQAGDSVRVGYEPDNTPVIVGYATLGDLDPSDSTPRQSGYADATRMAQTNQNGMRIWRKLRPGEWDMRSSGGAEVHGDNQGTLTLAGGGSATLRLFKRRQEIRARAGLSVWSDGGGVEVRWGAVTRELTPGLPEVEVAAGPGSLQGLLTPPVPREWRVIVGTGTARYADEVVGDVRDELGLPLLSSSAQPLRYRRRIYGLTQGPGLSSEVLTVTVDALGQVAVTQTAQASLTGIAVTAPETVPLSISVGRMSLSATGGTLDLNGALGLRLGGDAATFSAVLGEALVTALQSLTVICPPGGGPSSPPVNAAAFSGALSSLVKVRA